MKIKSPCLNAPPFFFSSFLLGIFPALALDYLSIKYLRQEMVCVKRVNGADVGKYLGQHLGGEEMVRAVRLANALAENL